MSRYICVFQEWVQNIKVKFYVNNFTKKHHFPSVDLTVIKRW